MNLKYAVIGTGGIGGYYGGRLANSGKEVHFLFHSDYNYVIKNGLEVDSVDGRFILPKVNAYSCSEKMPKVDVVLVALKTTNNYLLKDLLQPLLKENTIIILIQNGLGIEEKLFQELPDCFIAGGLAFICSEKIGPGKICHMDYGKLTIGSYNVSDKVMLEQVCADLETAGVPTELSNDLNNSRWQKLVWNIPFNGLTVVINASTKELVSDLNTKDLIYEMMKEVVAAGNYCGADLDLSFADKMIDLTQKMTPYAPSMKVDFDSKRKLEIDAIYTQPILFAKRTGFSMKHVEVIEKQLLFLDSRNRK